MRKIYLAIFIQCIFTLGKAQQGMMVSQYLFNKLYYNPGYAGSSNNLNTIFMYRNQWSGIQGQPIQYMFSGSTPIGESNHNIGMNFNLDKIGPMSNYNLYGNYAYKLTLDEDKSLRIGLRGGMDFGVINNTALAGHYEGDPNFVNDNSSYYKPVLGTGIYFESKKLALSASVPDVLPGGYDFTNYKDNYKSVLKGYAGAEYVINLHENWDIKPAVQVRYNASAPLSLDANTYVIYKQFLWVGAGYRTSGTFMMGTMVVLNKNIISSMKNEFRFGYAYDVSNSKYSASTNGAHELFVSFNLFNPNSERYINSVSPRYF